MSAATIAIKVPLNLEHMKRYIKHYADLRAKDRLVQHKTKHQKDRKTSRELRVESMSSSADA
jgi:hypothetical protein